MIVDISTPIYNEKIRGVHLLLLKMWSLIYFTMLFVDLGLCYIFIRSLDGFVIIIILTDILLFFIQLIFCLQIVKPRYCRISYYSLFIHNLISLLAFFLRLFVYMMILKDVKPNETNKEAKQANPNYVEEDKEEPDLGIIINSAILLFFSAMQTLLHIIFLYNERKNRRHILKLAQDKIDTQHRMSITSKRLALDSTLDSIHVKPSGF